MEQERAGWGQPWPSFRGEAVGVSSAHGPRGLWLQQQRPRRLRGSGFGAGPSGARALPRQPPDHLALALWTWSEPGSAVSAEVPAPQILLPCFRRSLWLQKSHADARKPHFLSRSSCVTARSAGDADTKHQSAGLCAGWRRGGEVQQPPSEGTACSVGFTPGDTYVYYVPQGSCDGGLLPSVHCRWFRTQPCAVRGQMRPCAVRV